jgi:predicted metal-dependent HD superfamily phosphohydrolase
MEAELRAAWSRDGGGGRAAGEVLDDLLGRYCEPHRRYHTLKHLASVLVVCDELLADVAVVDPAAVRLGAWFHDAVYDPRAATNEEASAALARRQLSLLGQPTGRVDAVCRLVLATAHHEPSGDDEAVLLDADLAILAARPAVYQAYATGVRVEYAHVDDEGWRTGRAAVLQSFLDRPAIFATVPMRAREPLARANLAAELASLRT